jgi:hypothetical protein
MALTATAMTTSRLLHFRKHNQLCSRYRWVQMLNFINCMQLSKQLVNRVYFLLVLLVPCSCGQPTPPKNRPRSSLTFIFAGLHTKEFNTLNSNLLPSQPDFLCTSTADGEKVRQSPCRVRCIVRHVLHISSTTLYAAPRQINHSSNGHPRSRELKRKVRSTENHVRLQLR